MTKRFLLFAGQWYYPGGGMDDFIGEFTTVEECREHAPKRHYNWWQIADKETMTIIAQEG